MRFGQTENENIPHLIEAFPVLIMAFSKTSIDELWGMWAVRVTVCLSSLSPSISTRTPSGFDVVLLGGKSEPSRFTEKNESVAFPSSWMPFPK